MGHRAKMSPRMPRRAKRGPFDVAVSLKADVLGGRCGFETFVTVWEGWKWYTGVRDDIVCS